MPITISCGATKIVDSTDTTQANLIVANKPHISSLVWALQRIGFSNINPY